MTQEVLINVTKVLTTTNTHIYDVYVIYILYKKKTKRGRIDGVNFYLHNSRKHI